MINDKSFINDEFVSIKEAAEMIGVSLGALYDAIHTDRIPSHRILNKYALKRADVIAYQARAHGEKSEDEVKRGGRPKKQIA